MGTIRNIQHSSSGEKKIHPLKKFILAVAVVVTTVTVYVFYSPTGNRAVYGNKVSTYITTEQGRKSEVAWLVKQGFNTYAGYGMSSYIKSNPAWVQDFVLKCRRAGIADVGFIYGYESTVLTDLDKYQKNCPNDSMKFSHVVSEIEQYQSDGDRPKFYKTIRLVSDWCLANKVKRYIYQGWPNQIDVDSIVKYSDRTYLHAYGVYSNYSDVGSWIYGYSKSRMASYATSVVKIHGDTSTYQYSIMMLYSCENPDQTRTQFGYKYFLTSTVENLHQKFLTYNTIHMPSTVKKRVQISGSVLFVEDQYKKIKP